MAKLLFYDLETTGINPAKNGIHQISGCITIDGIEQERFNFHVQPNPKAIIEEQALQVAGVTKEQIRAYPSMQQVYQQFVSMLSKYVNKYSKTDKFFLAGYNNAAFDNNFLRGFFLQNDDKYFGSWFWSNTIDVMVLAAQYLLQQRPQMANFKLATVAQQLGIAIDDQSLHDAYYDIYLTQEVYKRITQQ